MQTKDALQQSFHAYGNLNMKSSLRKCFTCKKIFFFVKILFLRISSIPFILRWKILLVCIERFMEHIFTHIFQICCNAHVIPRVKSRSWRDVAIHSGLHFSWIFMLLANKRISLINLTINSTQSHLISHGRSQSLMRSERI